MATRKWTVDITGEDELFFRREDPMTNLHEEVQKRISETPQNDVDYFDAYWTREVATFLAKNPFLNSRWPREMQHLQWTLFHKVTGPTHQELARSLLTVMKKWMLACIEDKDCLARPSRAMMNDKEFMKIMSRLNRQGAIEFS